MSLRLLGEVEMARGARRLALPPSKKTRALLAYLAVTGRPHRRERLCALFWDVTDDPRGALRWSLTRLRALVDEPSRERLITDRDTVAFDPGGMDVDVLRVRRDLEAGLESLDTGRLGELTQAFRGEFLEGLELPDFHEFRAWCVAERAAMRSVHADILRVLIARLRNAPEAALAHARSLVRVSPLEEAARAALVELLATTGRRQEAEQQLEVATRALDDAGVPRSGELSSAWHRVRTPGAAVGAPPARPVERRGLVERPHPPRTQYARSGGVNIAYQVTGEGPNLVMVPGWVSHVEFAWEVAGYAAFLRRLASFSRLILLDRRGTGLSDPVAALPTLEERADDVRAVMDAAGVERAALFGISEGGPMSMLLAATHPERVSALVLYGTFARGAAAPDYPWRIPPDQVERVLEATEARWGSGVTATALAPSIAGDPQLVEQWGRFERHSVSPGQVRALFGMMLDLDVRHVLPAIHTPTLVLHRADDGVVTSANGRYLAEHIAGARWVELPGADHFAWTEDAQAVLDEVQEFLTGTRPVPEADRVLATVLFVDIVGSTARLAALGDRAWRELLGRYQELVRGELARHRGQEVNTAGDSFLATFDGPARAIRCASAVATRVRALGLEVRTGLHTGECEVVGGDVQGLAVHIGARVAAAADPGEVLVTSTVKDLVVGSGLGFAPRGTHRLAGVPGDWTLFRVERR